MPLVRAGLLQTDARQSSAALRYGLALVFVCGALALNFLPAVRELPFLFFFGAVALSARYCGAGPAVMATFASATAVDFFLFPPSFHWSVSPADTVRLLSFVIVSFVIASVARKRSEAELNVQESRRRLAEILQSVSEGVMVLDRNSIVTYLNEPGARLSGVKINNILGKNVWDFFPQTRGSVLEMQYRRAMNENSMVRSEYCDPLQEKWYQVSAYPGAQGLTVFYQDIT